MDQDKTRRPEKAGTAIKLLYISLGIGALQVIFSALTHVPKLSTVSIIFGMFILVGPMWFFIYKTGKGRNWARITLLLWFIIGMLLDIPSILQRLETTPSPELLNIGATVISMVALVFLFRKPSSDWFKVKNFIIIVAVVFYTLLSSQALLAATSARPDYWPTQGWRTTSPEEQGMNSDMFCPYFTDKTIANIDENKKKITVENLLTMTTGLECIDGYRHRNKGLYEMWRSKNWAQYVLDLPMIEAPGDRFEYCSGATYLLSAILQKTAGMRTLDFAREYLFPPLGITDAYWETNPQGIDYGYDQLLLMPRDMVKIGWLYLNKGEWDGSQVVPSAWVTDSTRGHVKAGTISDHYGYQWWVEKGYYIAVGSGGQFIFVAPEENIVAVFTSAAPMVERFLGVKKLFKSFILASAVSINPLEPNPGDQKRLNDLLITVSQPPAKRPLSPMPKMSKTVSGRTYVFAANQLGLQSLTLTFPANSDEALLKQVFRGQARQLSVGLDNVFRITKANERLFAYKGAWEDANVFTYSYRYIDDSSFGDVHLEFKGEELIYTALNKTNNASYRATGKLSENTWKKRWLAGKTPIVLNLMNKLIPAEQPDKIKKGDILGSWTGSDTYGAEITFTFNQDDSFKVVREPSSLGRPSIGNYKISDTKITGEADTRVKFKIQKFGDELKGKWIYQVNGVSGKFTLKKKPGPLKTSKKSI